MSQPRAPEPEPEAEQVAGLPEHEAEAEAEEQEQEQEQEEHWLQDGWSFYYHQPDDPRWTMESYHRLGSASSVEDMWHLHRATLPHAAQGMLFVMRDHVFPCWDDKLNIDGGCLSIKVPIAAVPATWELLIKRAVGETLAGAAGASGSQQAGAAAAQQEDASGPPLNGLSISTKPGCAIIKLWLGDCKACGGARCVGCRSAQAGVRELTAAPGGKRGGGGGGHGTDARTATTFRLPDDYGGEVVYKTNRDNMQIDARRQGR